MPPPTRSKTWPENSAYGIFMLDTEAPMRGASQDRLDAGRGGRRSGTLAAAGHSGAMLLRRRPAARHRARLRARNPGRMIERAIAAKVPFSFVAADTVYGVGDIEMALRRAGKGYVLGVKSNQPFHSRGLSIMRNILASERVSEYFRIISAARSDSSRNLSPASHNSTGWPAPSRTRRAASP